MNFSGAEWALIIGNIATLVTAIGGFVVLLRRTDAVKADVGEVKAHVGKVETATNGLASRNEAIAQKLGVAEGKAQGLEQGREERRE